MIGRAATTRDNGFMGANVKFAGYNAVIFQGKSDKLKANVVERGTRISVAHKKALHEQADKII